MYGMMIVGPKGGGPKAQEVMIEQGEFYGDPDDKGMVSGDSKRMMDERPDFVVFNGVIEKYADHPIQIKVGRAGPDFLRECGTEPHFDILGRRLGGSPPRSRISLGFIAETDYLAQAEKADSAIRACPIPKKRSRVRTIRPRSPKTWRRGRRPAR